MVFAIDLDGTITMEELGHSEEEYRHRTPRPYVVAKLRGLWNNGHTIIIHTARYPEDREITLDWLHKHRVVFDELITGKAKADYYVDSKNITPEELLMNF